MIYPDSTTSPEDLKPKSIKEYPAVIEQSEKLRRLARSHCDLAQSNIQLIEDELSEIIENETYDITVGVKNPRIVQKKLYKSADSRNRELRKRLQTSEDYLAWKENLDAWSERCAEWVSHTARLRRELRLKESDYLAHGTT